MEDIKYKYFIIMGDYEGRIYLIDRIRYAIYILKDGKYINYNKKIEQLITECKNKDMDYGGVEIEIVRCLITGDEKYITKGTTILKTDILHEFDLKSLEIKERQIERMLREVKKNIKRASKLEPYYTYCLNSIDRIFIDELDKKILNDVTLE